MHRRSPRPDPGRSRRRRPRAAIAVACALVAGACSEAGLVVELDAGSVDRPGATPSPGDLVTDPDDVVDLALDDVEAFWSDTFPTIYGDEFEPVERLVPYDAGTPIPDCGRERLTYEDVAANALYCPDSDYIAWDRDALIPDLQERFGPLTVGIVMAHEYGHAIQSRAFVDGATVTLELQADCFAGAWVRSLDGSIPTFATESGALDAAMAGFLELRDTVGVSGRDPGAHGSGFDRISAFQDGFDGGAATCVPYASNPPDVVAIPFTSLDDFNSEGNLPIADLIEPLIADLESFYGQLVRLEGGTWQPITELVAVDPAVDVVTCGSERIAGADLELASLFCEDDGAIYLDDAELVPSLTEIGDFAFGGELARLYAFAAQFRLGIEDTAASLGLHADCLTGVYAAAEFGRTIDDQQLILSPGDLDEIIIAFLAFGETEGVTAFERTTAFRTGFVGGAGTCRDYVS